MEIMDVYSHLFRFMVLDPVLGLDPKADLHIAGFVYGAIGTLTAFLRYDLGVSPVIGRSFSEGSHIGQFPAFIPITFELTVLFSAVGMVVTYYTMSVVYGPGS